MTSWVEQRSEYDAAAEAEIIGKPQRVPPLRKEDLTPEVVEIVNAIRASIGLGPDYEMPGYVLTMIKHPDLFRGQMALGTAIFKGDIPPRERELAVLRIGWLMRAPYEWGEHVDIGQRYGVTKEEIERVTKGSTAPGWTEHEAAILRGVEELLSEQRITDETWAVLAKTWSERQLIEYPMMIGQYVATALLQNALRISLAADNPGLTYR